MLIVFIAITLAFEFRTVHRVSSRPIYASVCPWERSLLVLLENSVLVELRDGEPAKTIAVAGMPYGVICSRSGAPVLLHDAGQESITSMKDPRGVYIGAHDSHIYWVSWGIARKYIGVAMYIQTESGVFSDKDSFQDAVLPLQGSTYGCAISRVTNRVTCNDDPYSAISHISGIHRYGNDLLRIESSRENTPSTSMIGEESFHSKIPDDAEQVRLYSNAMGPIFCTYFHEGTWAIAKLSESKR